MTDPVVASRTPFPADVEAGKSYWWCACGQSASQPYCDGTHKRLGLAPIKFDATTTGRVWLCGCKRTAHAPFCDGSHKNLSP